MAMRLYFGIEDWCPTKRSLGPTPFAKKRICCRFIMLVLANLCVLLLVIISSSPFSTNGGRIMFGPKVIKKLSDNQTKLESLNKSSLFYPNDDAFFRKIPATKPYSGMGMPPHNLVLTKPEFAVCNAPKTGCTAWKFFWEYVNKGTHWNISVAEKNPDIIHDAKLGSFAKKSDGLEMVAIARNPYVRFLSSYQDWLYRVHMNQTQFSFDKFTDEFLKFKKTNKKGLFMGLEAPANHIDTVSKHCRIGIYNYTVLRVEEQALWFNQFLVKYHLKEKMDEYTSFGNLVFSSGLRESSLVKDFAAQLAGREPWPSAVFNSSHHRGSAEKITQYYSPAIAKGVTEIVYDDLVNFGYPLWNGVADSFRLV